MNWLIGWIGKLPTMQARVCVTLGAVIITTLRYALGAWVLPAWAPSYEWLAFLALMSGLDLTTFKVKRATDANYVAALKGNGPPQPPLPEVAPLPASTPK